MNEVASFILEAYDELAIDWDSMTQQERTEYLKKHPNSKYADKNVGEKRQRYQRLKKEAEDNVKKEQDIAKHYKQLLDNLIHKG